MTDVDKPTLGQRRRQKREQHRTCRHFTGVCNKVCAAGVEYDAFRCGPAVQLPCLLLRPDVPQATCEKYVERTQEELDAEERETNEAMAKHILVIPFVSEWRKKPPRGKQEVVECPACKGRLHLSQSAGNGHVWGRCQTKGCVSWIE